MNNSSWMKTRMGQKLVSGSTKGKLMSKQHKPNGTPRNFWRLAASLLIFQGVVLSTPAQAQQTNQKTLNYGQLLQKVEDGKVVKN